MDSILGYLGKFKVEGTSTTHGQLAKSSDIPSGVELSANVSEFVKNFILDSVIKSPTESEKARTESLLVNMLCTLKSKDSESIDNNTLQVPVLQTEFVYQFFVDGEEDTDSQENPSLDPFLKKSIFDVPRYVELTWQPIAVKIPLNKEETSRVDDRIIDQQYFGRPQGSVSQTSDTSNVSYETNKSFSSPFYKDGKALELVDTHQLDLAMNSVSNDSISAGSIKVTVASQEQNNAVLSTVTRNAVLGIKGT